MRAIKIIKKGQQMSVDSTGSNVSLAAACFKRSNAGVVGLRRDIVAEARSESDSQYQKDLAAFGMSDKLAEILSCRK